MGGTGAPGGGSAMSVFTDSPLSGMNAGDVDERRHAWVCAGLGDDGPAVGVSDENHRTVLVVEDPLGGGHIPFEGQRGVLDDGDVVPVVREQVVDAPPARAVNEPAVHENNISGVWIHDVPFLLGSG